mgnify:CR=1 FL=1
MAIMIILLLILSSASHAQFDLPEWQVVVPETNTLISGVHAGPTNPVLINDQGVASAFELQDFLSFDPNGQTTINAIGLKESDDSDPIILIAFSTAVDNFSMGDVLECQNQVCNVVFNPQSDLGVSEVTVAFRNIYEQEVDNKTLEEKIGVINWYANEVIAKVRG